MTEKKSSVWKNLAITAGAVVFLTFGLATWKRDVARSATRSTADNGRGLSAQDTAQTPVPVPRPALVDGFQRHELKGGIAIDVPSGWKPNTAEETDLVNTSAAAKLAVEGLEVEPSSDLLVLKSRPRTTYALVRIEEFLPAPIAPDELRSASEAEVASIGPEMYDLFGPMMAKSNQAILGSYDVKREEVSGYPALVVRYRRNGVKGPVVVEQIRLMTPAREVSFTLAYRESEAGLWSSVKELMRRSIHVPPGL